MPARTCVSLVIFCIAVMTLALIPTPDRAKLAHPQPPDERAKRSQTWQAGNPRRDLTAKQRAAFWRGKKVFRRIFLPKDGLGPYYNDVACAACHSTPAIGGFGRLDNRVLVSPNERGEDEATQLFPKVALKGYPAVPKPPPSVTLRVAPSLLGLGLLNDVPDSVIEAVCKGPHPDGVGGMFVKRDGAILRFGHRPFKATLRDFIATALQNEMGITSRWYVEDHPTSDPAAKPTRVMVRDADPVPDPEIDEKSFAYLVAFVWGLAPPKPAYAAPRGQRIFEQVGCGVCHRPAIGNVKGAYTDLCVHSLGPGLSDKIYDDFPDDAWRTSPLWGLRYKTYFLHNGSAKTVEKAILAHAGEAATALKRYKALAPDARKELLFFLDSL